MIHAGRLQRLAHRRITEDDRHIEFGHGLQERIVLVLLDDQDVVASGGQIGHHAYPDGPESDHHDVPPHVSRPQPSGGVDEAPRQQQIREKRGEDSGDDHPAEHQPDGEQSQERGLVGETEIAVADGSDGLGGEVQGVEPRQFRVVVPQAHHHRRAERQQQREQQRGIDQRIEVVAHGAERVDRASRPGVAGAGRTRRRHGDAAGLQLVLDADHRGPVTGVDLLIPPGARHHLTGHGRVPTVYHRHRRQVGIKFAQRCVVRGLGSPDDEFDSSSFELVGVTGQDRLDDGGCRQVGEVQNRAGAVDAGHPSAQHLVRQSRHHAYVRTEFSRQQSNFEVHRVVGPGADHGAGAVHAGGA